MGRCWKVRRLLTACMALAMAAAVPVCMSGCGTTAVPTSSPAAGTMPGVAGNQRPSFSFVKPDRALTVSVGDTYTISWIDDDPDDDALIDLYLDPDEVHDSGNELLILGGRSEDADTLEDDRLEFDTSAVPAGNYFLRAVINDGVNAPVLVDAPGGFNIVAEGTAPLNQPPQVLVTDPAANRSVAQDDVLVIRWEDQDVDSNALVLVTLDLDADPNNDDVQDATDTGRILLHQTLEDPDPDPADPNDPNANADTYLLAVDVTEVPVREDGKPYYVKVTLVDGVNPPVHAYAPGQVYVLSLAEPEFDAGSGQVRPVDLARVGTVTSGATLHGFHAGMWVASRSRTLGDFDADGVDDFCLVARYGSPIVGAPVGQAYIVYGLPPVPGSGSERGERFGGRISVNEISMGVSGALVHAPLPWWNPLNDLLGGPNLGITDVSFLPDDGVGVSGDGRPEVVFGVPHTDGLVTQRDDDPGDSAEGRTFLVSPTFNSSVAQDSHVAGPGLAGNCNAETLVVGPTFDDAAYLNLLIDDITLAEMLASMTTGTDVEATLSVWVAVPNADLRLIVQGYLETDPYPGACVAAPSGYLPVTIEPELQVAQFGEIEIDVSDYVEAVLGASSSSGRGSLIFGMMPAATGNGSVEIFSMDSDIAPSLEITINADEFVVGCYWDPYVNNFSSSTPSDDPADEDVGFWASERLGAAFMVYSSNRDNDGFINTERLEATSFYLDEVGQQGGFGGSADPDLESGDRISGSRLQVGLYDWYAEDWLGVSAQGPLQAHYGQTVDCLPDMNNDDIAELIISAPRNELDWAELFATYGYYATHFWSRVTYGNVQVYFGQDFSALGEDWFPSRRGDDSNSVIPWIRANSATCGESSDDAWRNLVTAGGQFQVFGEAPDDELGNARFGGDFDGNGTPDLAMGAPKAWVNLMPEAGKAYLWFSTPSNQGPREVHLWDLDDPNPALRPDVIRIHGEHPNDHLGTVQGLQQDFDGNGVDDVVFASGDYDWNGVEDTGAVAIVLGQPGMPQGWASGDYLFSDIGGPTLPGVIFYGANPGDRAGADACGSGYYNTTGVTTGADFNGDGLGDLLIVAPGATGFSHGLPRSGMVYLIYGGTQLYDDSELADNVYSLDEVGTTVPGMVFVSPYAPPPDADSAAPTSASFLGDINADGFADIMIGNPLADFVSDFNPGGARVEDAGEAYLIYGNNTGCNDPGNWYTTDCFGD